MSFSYLNFLFSSAYILFFSSLSFYYCCILILFSSLSLAILSCSSFILSSLSFLSLAALSALSLSSSLYFAVIFSNSSSRPSQAFSFNSLLIPIASAYGVNISTNFSCLITWSLDFLAKSTLLYLREIPSLGKEWVSAAPYVYSSVNQKERRPIIIWLTFHAGFQLSGW